MYFLCVSFGWRTFYCAENAVKIDGEYRKVEGDVVESQAVLLKTMSDVQKVLFEEYYRKSVNLSALEERGYFEYGFKLGAQIMMKVLYDS